MNIAPISNPYQINFDAYRLGVSGNIAAGKTTVQRHFERNGIKCIDVDDVCHDLYDHDEKVISQVKNLFSEYGIHDIENDEFIDRRKIGKYVFQDKELRKDLESIVHPAVEEKVEEFVKENEDEKFVAIFNPLLFEKGAQKNYDKTLFIKIGPQLQLERLMQRNPYLTEEDALERINSQMPQEAKAKNSDFVINNSFGYENTEKQVIDLLQKLDKEKTWKEDSKKPFSKRLKEYFTGYTKRINYTWEHKKAFLKVEKDLYGKNTLGGYCHDLDKLIMYILGVPKNVAHDIHVATAPHHMRNGKIKSPEKAVIDWESARYTKPDKPLSARDFYEKCCPKMPEIEEEFEKVGI